MSDLEAVMRYVGKKVIVDHRLVDITEDWTRVRSPGRARRRRRIGHRQRVVVTGVPKREVFETREFFTMHPAVFSELVATLKQKGFIDA
jgi:hypothetical protein